MLQKITNTYKNNSHINFGKNENNKRKNKYLLGNTLYGLSTPLIYNLQVKETRLERSKFNKLFFTEAVLVLGLINLCIYLDDKYRKVDKKRN